MLKRLVLRASQKHISLRSSKVRVSPTLSPRTAVLACNGPSWYIATSEEATRALSAALAGRRRKADCICLRGEVGAGKSAFSRAYIRCVEEDDTVPVPSPTYLLQNVYEYKDGPAIYHYDLYRLQDQAALQKLDLHASLTAAVNLIEWPDRLQQLTPSCRLDLTIAVVDPEVKAKALAQNVLPQPIANGDEGLNAEEEEESDFVDDRWRLICLQPYGQHWKGVSADVQTQQLSIFGLHSVTEELLQGLGLELEATLKGM